MGLIITSEIFSDGGNTSEAYVNIRKYNLIKDTGLGTTLNLYLNKESRENDPSDTVESKSVPNSFGISADAESPSDFILLNDETIYKFTYGKLKEYLESKGLTVEDDL